MQNLLKYCAFACSLLFFLFVSPEAQAQKKSKSRKQIQKEQGQKGPDGLVRGGIPAGNAERKYLVDRQQVLDQQRQGGFSAGAGKSMPQVKYESANSRFKLKDYENKNAKLKSKKKSKRLIDQENPDGKMYQQAVRKRERKLFIF